MMLRALHEIKRERERETETERLVLGLDPAGLLHPRHCAVRANVIVASTFCIERSLCGAHWQNALGGGRLLLHNLRAMLLLLCARA